MLQKNSRHVWYALLLITLSVVCTTAVANTRVYTFIAEVASSIETTIVSSPTEDKNTSATHNSNSTRLTSKNNSAATSAMFMTIIQGADDEVVCTIDGTTVARFILCGDSDDREISVGGGSSFIWEELTGIPPDTNVECPNTAPSNYTQVATTPTFDLDASSVSSTTGAEYRVQVDGGFWYYFEVVKSTITQTFSKEDFVCNNPGRIEITGLPNSYEFQIREGSNPFSGYQSSSIFDNLSPGLYTVQARLNISGQVCEYLYDVIEIEQVDIDIAATVTNPVCAGEVGSIYVEAQPDDIGPYEFTLLDEFGAEVAFTAPISDNFFTFNSVSEGIYSVKVETPECAEDIANGIPAPVQYNDINGNIIEVGLGLDPITVSTDTGGLSFGCPPPSGIETVNIDVTPSGGSGTYSFTVSDGGNSGGNFTGTFAYPITSPGTYTFFVTDDQGCTAEKSEYVALLDPPNVTAAPIIGTCTNGGGKVEFTINDPMGFNLEFRATNNATDPWTSSPTIPVADGTYNIVEVRYSQGAFSCVLPLPPVTVTSDGGLTFSASLTSPYTCAAGATITFTAASGGSGSGYEYSLDPSDLSSWQSTLDFTGLAPGSYIPHVRDDAGCLQGTTPIDIAGSTPPDDIDLQQDQLDCASGTSRVTINVLPGGFPVAEYRVVSSIPATTLPPAQVSNVFPGLNLDTSYQFEIVDTGGCIYTASITTGGFSSIRAQVQAGGDRRVCTGDSDGSATYIIDGFATDYDYEVTYTAPSSAPVIHSTGTSSNLTLPLSGLAIGNYSITVTDNDTNCSSTVAFDINGPTNPLNVTATVTDMSCQNGNVGRIRANGSGGFPGYTYELEDPLNVTTGPQNNRNFSNLIEPGDYFLTIIDSEGCRFRSGPFTLTPKTLPTITEGAIDYCYSATNQAEITVTSALGGAPPNAALLSTHEYRINGGALQVPGTAGTFTFTNLVPGTYTIEVVDGNNCSAQLLPITIEPQIQVALDISREIPCGGDGEMEIDITGGDISNLGTTSYTIEYRDVAPNPFAPVAGHIGIPLPSGNFNYTVPFGNHGDYRVTVTDSNGCPNTSEILNFTEPTNIAATHRVVGPSCADPNSGFVEVIPTVSSGVPPFLVVFAPAGTLVADPNNPDPTNTYNFSTQTVYSGLAAGNYEYIVRDSRDGIAGTLNCITTIIPVTVVDDPTPAPDASITPIDATCSPSGLSGGVTINPMISPGVPNYTVTIEDNFGNPFYTQNNVAPGDLPLNITDPALVPGNYQVIVIDSRGCNDIESLAIGTTSLDLNPIYPLPPPTCTPGGVTVCVEILNGTGPYEIRLIDPDPLVGWVSPNGPPGPPPTHCFSGLLSGVSYTVEVRDLSTGCEYSEVITPPDGPGMSVSLTADGATCRNGDVGVNYNITTGTAPYNVIITNLDTGVIEYNVTGSNLTTLATDLTVPAGRYGISVEDSNDCTNGAEAEAIPDLPRVDIIDNQNANCNELGQLTVRATGGTGPYEYAFVEQGTVPPGTIPPLSAFDSSPTAALAGSLAPGITYDIWVVDANNCPASTSAAVIQMNPDLPAPTIIVDNQCDVTATAATGFNITVEMPGNIDTPTFTLNGESQTPVYIPGTPTQAVFTVYSVGPYPVHVIDANGCDVDDVAEVFQILSASGTFTTEPNCENPDGVVTITANGGSGNFTYRLTGLDFLGGSIDIVDPDNDGIFQNIPPGDYQVVVQDQIVADGAGQCEFLVDDIFRSRPIQPVIDDTGATDITCRDNDDGTINVSLVLDADPTLNPNIKEYNLYSSTLAAMPANYDFTSRIDDNLTGSFTGLASGTYVVEVVTDKNCFDREEVTIINPPAFTIDAVAGTLVCEVGANRFSTTTITLTVNGVGNGNPYAFKINPTDSYQTTTASTMDFLIVDTGVTQTFTVSAIDSNGCEFIFPTPIVIDPPSEVEGLISQLRPMDCENPERIRIDVTDNSGTPNFYIEDQGSSVAPVANQTPNPGESFVEFDLPLVAGEYRLQIVDVGGCTYPLEPYTVVEPELPTATIVESNPIRCITDTNGALEITVNTVPSFSGVYEYWVYDASDPGFAGGAFAGPVQANAFVDIATDGNPFLITGLSGGTKRVVIREQGKTVNGCNVFSDVATIRVPNGDLLINTFDEIGRVGCNNDLGELIVTAIGGWDNAAYEFMLEYDDGSGFAPHPTYGTYAMNGTNDRFTGLSSGDYRVTVRDIEGCEATDTETLSPVPPIQAEAIITRELECPLGNDAIITAVEPGTTTPGAIGGILGAGYQFRLLRIDETNLDPSNPGALDLYDPANILSVAAGLQASPEFVGSGGTGVVEAGWYAVEVVSTLNCQTFTVPIQVIPPPPINPVLIQTAVPACGNIATMMIRVNNPDGGSYEYNRIYPPTDPLFGTMNWLPITGTNNGVPAEIDIPGNVNESYRYEVRKVGSLSSCQAVKTNGLLITEADPLSLDPASPTFNVSCALQVDGRIEAIAEGGTGIYEFRIYDYDPDPANPDGSKDAFVAESLPTYENRPQQDFGTFENLGPGTYYISVISRLNCGVISLPFTIDEPAEVTIADASTPTSCYNSEDGTITMTVTSATAGLVKFAIEPNLSEFFTDPDNPMVYTFTDLPARPQGEGPGYTVLAQDAEGCPQTFEVFVERPAELLITDVQTTPETCIGFEDGTVQLSVSGGTPFVDPSTFDTYYETRIVGPNSDGSEVFERNDNLYFDNLIGGASYLIFVKGVSDDCVVDTVVPIEIGVDLSASHDPVYGCNGIFPYSTVSIVMDDPSLIPDLFFALDPIDPTTAFTANAGTEYSWGDLPAGEHTVYIYHLNGCTNSVTFTMETYEPLTLSAEKTGPNEVTAIAEGGFGNYEYFFQGESYGAESIYTQNENGTVNIEVRDEGGCVATIAIPFEFTGMLDIPNFFTPDGDNNNDFWAPNNREFFPNIEVKIYDRYGRVVAILDQVSKWDGKYEGTELPTGDYWYVVNANDKSEVRYVGHFTLYR
ncbi:T9SS type B sorting domain-containing protein [Maribacter sp. 2308TA10-17]|uniref:T9SS type B sorting domain-containing protein n=1 Tax=Maribacter sp. 2308TA10-17 TaxID=3386276 RepID=UPI0039BC41DD